MIKIFETQEELAEAVAVEMAEQLHTMEHPVFCLASGDTPAKSYQKFIHNCSEEEKLHGLRFVSLDEWVGVEEGMVGSCYQMLDKDLFSQLPISREQITFFKTKETNLCEECERIDQFIRENPITFSLMGVGMNGHIGLNEPGSVVKNYSTIVPLSETTKTVAQKYFTKQTELEEGITIGLGQVISSKRVIAVITGSHKKQIVKEILESTSSDLPAQTLLGHQHIDFFLDKEAAELLEGNYEVSK